MNNRIDLKIVKDLVQGIFITDIELNKFKIPSSDFPDTLQRFNAAVDKIIYNYKIMSLVKKLNTCDFRYSLLLQ